MLTSYGSIYCSIAKSEFRRIYIKWDLESTPLLINPNEHRDLNTS